LPRSVQDPAQLGVQAKARLVHHPHFDFAASFKPEGFELFAQRLFERRLRSGFFLGVTGARHPQHSPEFF
jgi:hypothetical protein